MTTIDFVKPIDVMPPPMHPRRELSNRLWIEARKKFLEFGLNKSPKKPSKVPGLYSLVEKTSDIIDLDLLHCKDKSKDAILTLHANGLLGRKVFNAWGAFSLDPAIRDGLPMPVYEAAKPCLEAFRKKDEDLMQNEIAAFIRHNSDMHTYNQLINAWEVSISTLKKNMIAYVAEDLKSMIER